MFSLLERHPEGHCTEIEPLEKGTLVGILFKGHLRECFIVFGLLQPERSPPSQRALYRVLSTRRKL